jgi:hypothetical protein
VADSGHLLDENTIVKEMFLHTGKIVGFIIIYFLSSLLSLNYLFFIAILASLFLTLIPNTEIKKI